MSMLLDQPIAYHNLGLVY